MKTLGRERCPLTRQSGPQHVSKWPTMNLRSGGPKPSLNPSWAAGAGLGKMDAQHASGLRFGPSTHPQKANKKIYVVAKDGPEGAQLGHRNAHGAAAPPQTPNGPSLRVSIAAMSPMSVAGCTARFSVPGR
jgi:hypothetical protein